MGVGQTSDNSRAGTVAITIVFTSLRMNGSDHIQVAGWQPNNQSGPTAKTARSASAEETQ
jgi:hypothetical protein